MAGAHPRPCRREDQRRPRGGGRKGPPPAAPDWWIEYTIGATRKPDRVHTGACRMTGRGRPATRESVLEVLRTMPTVIACPLCRPDSELGLLER
ncbi:DUF6233 domain-containing protein [Streptomyces sp. NPDC006662]|uniref:DUF6233 domain-containing protein n=1 Tax=Streptomyces sp. NPDC006662 TaxID=3156902 RepID=UPI0033EAE8FB